MKVTKIVKLIKQLKQHDDTQNMSGVQQIEKILKREKVMNEKGEFMLDVDYRVAAAVELYYG